MSSPTPPQRIGRYEIEEYLGGGMSMVYRARDPQMGRTVVLKLLKESYRPDDATAQRFVLEVQIAGSLNHENVIRTYDFGFDPEGRPFMVLEYLEGEDLLQAIKGRRTGSLAVRAAIAAQLAAALEYIHPRDVVHRDLKPANVYLSTGSSAVPKVKLMDFGIARTGNVALTQAGMTLGTPGYMAPEQVRGEKVTKAADIYAFAVVVWELFAGERAFSGDTLERVFYRVLHEPLDLERLRVCGLPEELVQQLGKCASKEEWGRPPNLVAIRNELLRLADPEGEGRHVAPAPADTPTVVISASPVAAPPAASPTAPGAAMRPPSRNMVWVGAGVGVLVAVLAGSFVIFSGGSPPSKDPGAPPASTTVLAPRIATPTGDMMLVPAGAFRFGKNAEQTELPAFYVDRTEVTNQAYAEFARATGAALPPGFEASRPELPVVNVTFLEAQAYADWAHKWLPTSKQWEKAARGTDGRQFPWGDGAAIGRANTGGGKSGALTAADGYEEGASPFAAVQMVGNAWEWVDETAAPSPEAMAGFAAQLTPPPAAGDRWVRIRGGSFLEPLDPNVMWDAAIVPARYRSRVIGFRCVKPAARP